MIEQQNLTQKISQKFFQIKIKIVYLYIEKQQSYKHKKQLNYESKQKLSICVNSS